MLDAETILQYFVSFVLSVSTAYIDLRTFFLQKARYALSPFHHSPSIVFLVFNGALAVLLMHIAITNHWISENKWLLAFLSGLGAAGLLRSKFFTFGQNNIEAGFEYLYNFIKNSTIARLSDDSGRRRIRISFQLAEQYKDANNLNARLDNVANEIARSPNWENEKSSRFTAEYHAMKNDASYYRPKGQTGCINQSFHGLYQG